MIRRNTANQTIYLPQLRLTADGAAVTSAATIVVSKDGTEAASAGSLTHYAGGVWKYTPTQNETDAAIVGLILTATAADTVVLNLVTTGADTSAVALGALAPTVSGRTLNVSDGGAGDAVLDTISIDAIWNEVLTGATHNIASSAGRRLRQLAETVILLEGECAAASNAGTSSTGTITLAIGTTTACVGQAIRCENQVRFITSYNTDTRVAELDRPWCVVPDSGDEYVVFNVRNPLVGLSGLAVSGSHAAAINDILEDTGTTLPGLIGGIPKVGSTHRYTQIAQTSTTTDVAIGEAT
jgi:hypothetical protein